MAGRRWSASKDLPNEPSRPERIGEVNYGQRRGDRFQNAISIERWRHRRTTATNCTG